MSKLIIGCDPDSKASGFAIYRDGKLAQLLNLSVVDFYLWLVENKTDNTELHIENLCGISSSAFSWHRTDSINVKAKKSEHVGMCKQVQRELEEVAERLGVKVVHHKVSPNWKNHAGKAQFEKLTGWTCRSNEDTRSAAFFGYLGSR